MKTRDTKEACMQENAFFCNGRSRGRNREYFTKYKVKFSLVALSSSEKNLFVKRFAFSLQYFYVINWMVIFF